MAANKGIFLTAEWRKLALAQYTVDQKILLKYLPPHTELDTWDGKYYVSLVGFMFKNVKLRGFSIPLHTNFEEVNLRFYVRYQDGEEWKRGVVFIKEIVPLPAITFVANTIYKENYQTLPMRHVWITQENQLEVDYLWKNKTWNSFEVIAHAQAEEITPGSEEEFITEHYWGYTKIGHNKTAVYGVEHPRWQTYPVKSYKINVDFGINYGKDFAFLNHARPDSVFLAEGSAIKVLKGKQI
ncbi:YqjF family protein [Pedobacter sp. KLB.chiD]|uniref:YqjF family protein n=1 Tax=Pedobacter sp. KLB.chiD TaxID=3387402 RepID=UPI003999C0C0